MTRTETGKVTRVDNLAFDPVAWDGGPGHHGRVPGLAFEHGVRGIGCGVGVAADKMFLSGAPLVSRVGRQVQNDRKQLRSGGLFDGVSRR